MIKKNKYMKQVIDLGQPEIHNDSVSKEKKIRKMEIERTDTGEGE